jgi:hypothetical protein
MNAYTGSQAHERAFLKSLSFAHENELRVATMILLRRVASTRTDRRKATSSSAALSMYRMARAFMYWRT